MYIGLLGPLELRDATGQPVAVTGARQRALLCRLALDPGRVVTVDRLVDDLWAAAPAAAGNALQSAVSRLRRDLDRAGPPGRNAVGSHPAGYRLGLSPARVDLHEFERLVASGTSALRSGDAELAAGVLREALGLWRGPALAGAGDAPFVAAAVARAEELRLTALEARAAADLARGADPSVLVTELSGACAAHPLREGLAARLVRALVAAGRRAEALERYEATRRVLADQLGVDPGPELRNAHLSALREDEPPGVVGRRGNLPSALTSFVGRAEELARTAELLAAGRLVTLTGPGGVGKTRLALEAAATVTGVPDGVWLVELAGVPPDGLADAVLTTLARPTVVLDETSGDPVERLRALLRARRLLLVLDNAEHVAEPLAVLVAGLLAAAPGVRALVTSREPLGVVGEALCPVPPLPDSPAVRLFAARAAAVRPGFGTEGAGGTDGGEILRICRALDGLPLAIELAAARLRSLSLEEVASRLDDRFALLGRGTRGGVARHRTLRAVMDGSWELLGVPERTVLRRLSVFAGPATLGAVDAVCGGGLPGGDLPDVVGDLVDRSLLVPVDGADGRRYRLLETVRLYAAERLAEAREGAQVAAAHTAYVLECAERDEPVLRTGAQLGAIARFQAWHADLDAAKVRALGAGDVRVARRLVAARSWFWWLTGQRGTAASWAAQALAIGPVAAPVDEATGMCLVAVGAGGTGLARVPTAPSAEREAAPSAERGTPGALEAVAGLAHPAGMFAGAWLGDAGQPGWMAAAAVRFAHHRDPWCRAASRVLAGHAAWDAGDADRAHAAFAAARALFTPLGERWGLLLAAFSIAMVTAADEPDAALAALREAEALAEELDGLSEIPELLVRIAVLAGRLGDHVAADDALDRADVFAASADDALLGARIAHARGEVARYAGDLGAAAAHHRAALALLAAAGGSPGAAGPVAGMGDPAARGAAPTTGAAAGPHPGGSAGPAVGGHASGGPPAAARFSAQLHSCLARVETERGSPGAGAWHARALELSARTGDAPLRADVLERFAAWCARTDGNAERGARALGAAWALRRGSVTPPGAPGTHTAGPRPEAPGPGTSGPGTLGTGTPGTGTGGGRADSAGVENGRMTRGGVPEAAEALGLLRERLGADAFDAAWRAGASAPDGGPDE